MQKTITSSKYASLVAWLKKSRLDQDISLRELAARLDIPHSFIQRVEMMERRLDVFEYTLYCEALGVDPMEGLKILMRKATH